MIRSGRAVWDAGGDAVGADRIEHLEGCVDDVGGCGCQVQAPEDDGLTVVACAYGRGADDGGKIINESRFAMYPGLADWWSRASEIWIEHLSSDRLTLREQLDYRRKVTMQFPAPEVRVVYTASGMHLSAARIEDPRGVIEHGLYWAAVQSLDEAAFLCGILNSPRTTALTRPLMSYGKDERHIDKYVWQLPIPLYDAGDERHRRLVQLANAAEAEVADLDLDESVHFPTMRRRIRDHFEGSDVGQEIEDLVTELIG